MNSTGNSTVEGLPIFMCLLIDIPETGQDCSLTIPEKCVKCRIRSEYLTGESVNDYGGTGHAICLMLWILSASIGIAGILGNIFIVAVLRRRSGSDKGFDYLLTILAYFDITCCVMGVLASTCHVIYLGNWSGKGIFLLYVFYLSWILLLFGRSASQFMTVAITIERWLVITFPFRSSLWFTSTKTKLISFAILFAAILLSVPRSTSRYVGNNPYSENGDYEIASLRDLEYYLRSTPLTKFWYQHLRSVHYQIDFWTPLPLLLFFNFLSFWQVRKLSARRKEMNMKEKKEIQAVKMFLPVVVVLLICNFGPISMFVMVHFYKILYREMYMTTIFSICLTSAVNFIIYYYLGANFKTEVRAVLQDWFNLGGGATESKSVTNSSTFGSSSKGMELPSRKTSVSSLPENKLSFA